MCPGRTAKFSYHRYAGDRVKRGSTMILQYGQCSNLANMNDIIVDVPR